MNFPPPLLLNSCVVKPCSSYRRHWLRLLHLRLPVQLPCHDLVLSSSSTGLRFFGVLQNQRKHAVEFHPNQGGGGTLARRLVTQVLS